ncbi:MAG TPA: hypothetical protein VEA59_07410 [Patescibacteria group bacterium]|nr:hypothetical protein [Patescibacteria group bacterium]
MSKKEQAELVRRANKILHKAGLKTNGQSKGEKDESVRPIYTPMGNGQR